MSSSLELNPDSGQKVFVYLAAQEQGLHLALESGGVNRVSVDAKSVTGSPPSKSRRNMSKSTVRGSYCSGEAVRAADSPRVPSEPPAGWPTGLHRRGSLRAVYPAKKKMAQ